MAALNQPTWQLGSMTATCGVLAAAPLILVNALDSGSPPTHIMFVGDPTIQITDALGVSLSIGASTAASSWIQLSSFSNVLAGLQVKAHGTGSTQLFCYFAHSNAGLDASPVSSGMAITASIATETTVTADASETDRWDFGAILRADIVGHVGAGILNGDPINAPGSQVLDLTGPGYCYVPNIRRSSTTAAWYCSSANSIWFTGTGNRRGMAPKGYVDDHSDYPGGSSVGGPENANFATGVCSTYGSLSIVPRNHWAIFVIEATTRGAGAPVSESDPACIYSLNDKFILQTDAANIIGVGTTLDATNRNTDAGGAANALYAHCATQIIAVRSNGTNIKVRTWHDGAVNERTLTALGNVAGATTATGVVNLFDSVAGGAKCWGKVLWAAFGNDGTIADAVVDGYMASLSTRFALTAHTKKLAAMGDSRFVSYHGVPGQSIPSIYAQANPTVKVVNFAGAGLGVVTDMSVTQMGRVSTFLGVGSFTAKGVLLWGGTNDILGGTTPANIDTAVGVIVAAVHAAGGKICVLNESIKGTAGSADGVIAGYETSIRSFNALLAARTSIDNLVDLRGAMFPTLKAYTLTGTAATDAPIVRNACAGLDADARQYMAIPYSKWVLKNSATASNDGTHPGVVGIPVIASLASAGINSLPGFATAGSRPRTARRLLLGV